MLNERQLKIVDLLEQQPRTPGELAQQTGVSGRTILRDIDYLNFTLNGKARIFASGSAGYQLEIFERRSFFQLLQIFWRRHLFANSRSVFSLPPEVFIIRMYAVKAGNILPGKFVRN